MNLRMRKVAKTGRILCPCRSRTLQAHPHGGELTPLPRHDDLPISDGQRHQALGRPEPVQFLAQHVWLEQVRLRRDEERPSRFHVAHHGVNLGILRDRIEGPGDRATLVEAQLPEPRAVVGEKVLLDVGKPGAGQAGGIDERCSGGGLFKHAHITMSEGPGSAEPARRRRLKTDG